MRARAGDEVESASVTAARQLAEEAQSRVPRPAARRRRLRTNSRLGTAAPGPNDAGHV